MMDQCGRCHDEEATTFFDTFHGKVSRLGSEGTAKCYDCHGTHNILPTSDPDSALGRNKVVETCGECHEYDQIPNGYHFQQGRTDGDGNITMSDNFNPKKPWILSDGMYGKW